MNLAPDTTTIEAQRNTELLLLDYLRSTNPHVYALWSAHPDHRASSSSSGDSSDSESEDSTADAGPASSSATSSTSPAEASANGDNVMAEDLPFVYQEPCFHRAMHTRYASMHVGELPATLQGMYTSRPWVTYWCLQAADLLGSVESDLLARTPACDIAAFLHSCLAVDATCAAELQAAAQDAGKAARHAGEDSTGATDDTARPVIGFAGGPVHQWPHLVTSYAACCALAVLSRYDGGAALRQLPRAAIKRWLLALRNADGSFRVHGGGESDIRASYCAAVITALLCLDDPATFDRSLLHSAGGSGGAATPREYADDVRNEPVLTLQTAQFVASCQTHEGGFTCTSTASEAHGAYTQCGLAALLLMKQPHLVHQASLRRWLAARQLSSEGGFNGRTNKLVDSCYSHWIGASHVLLRTVEAFSNCFTAGDSTSGGAASSGCLRAREVVLLHHAQLLDATLIQSTTTDAWDAAETAHFQHVDGVEQFFGADDACLREATAKKATLTALYDDVWQQHEATAAKAEQAAGGEGKGGGATAAAQEHLRSDFHQRQAFLHEDVGDYYFNQRKLQDYVLRCCQSAEVGGLMDKPGTAHDAYHTCYSLSGMSAAQNLQYLTHASAATSNTGSTANAYLTRAFARSYLPSRASTSPGAFGVVLDVVPPAAPSPAVEMNVLRTTSPIVNIHQSAVLSAFRVWGLKTFL